MYAMGSLLPLSSSRSGRSCSFSPCRLLRRMEKTDAESVEDMTAAMSNAPGMVREAYCGNRRLSQ